MYSSGTSFLYYMHACIFTLLFLQLGARIQSQYYVCGKSNVSFAGVTFYTFIAGKVREKMKFILFHRLELELTICCTFRYTFYSTCCNNYFCLSLFCYSMRILNNYNQSLYYICIGISSKLWTWKFCCLNKFIWI